MIDFSLVESPWVHGSSPDRPMQSTAIRAVLDKVIVRVDKGSNSLNITRNNDKDSETTKPRCGVIVATGSNVKDCVLHDVVSFPQRIGFTFYLNDDEYVVMKELDVLMVHGQEL